MYTNLLPYFIEIYLYLVRIFVWFNNIFQKILLFINSYNISKDDSNTLVIKDSKIIQKFNVYNLNNDKINILYNYHYLVYKYICEDKILTSLFVKMDNLILELTPCNFEFLLVIIKVDEKTYDITNILNNKNNYYYIVNNNLFDSIFMDWLFVNHIKNKFIAYNIVLLDNNTNEKTINEKQHIKLNKNDYEIVNNF
tara:strand:- start:2136 stop:2723 length:588 start_codon:yes stop_codon:yes gene_type:complete